MKILRKLQIFLKKRSDRRLIRNALDQTAAMWMAYSNNASMDRALASGGDSEFMVFAHKVAIFRHAATEIFRDHYGISDPAVIDQAVVMVVSRCTGTPRSTVELAMLTGELPGTR
jgi:hypothetical protein